MFFKGERFTELDERFVSTIDGFDPDKRIIPDEWAITSMIMENEGNKNRMYEFNKQNAQTKTNKQKVYDPDERITVDK